MEHESASPYPEPRGPFPSREPIEPFEESLENSPFATSLENTKRELWFFLEELEAFLKHNTHLDFAEEKAWIDQFRLLQKELANFTRGQAIAHQLKQVEKEFEKLKKEPFEHTQQSLLNAIHLLRSIIRK